MSTKAEWGKWRRALLKSCGSATRSLTVAAPNQPTAGGGGATSPAVATVTCDLVACSDADSGEPLKQIMLTPDGLIQSTSGDFVMDAASARLVEAAFKARRGVDLVVDFEHQSLGGKFNERPDRLSPAAGWIKKIEYEPGRGLIGLVEWTEEATRLIRSKQYRYISPVTAVRRQDNRVVELISATLTNTPAIAGMEAVAAKRTPNTETTTMADEPQTTTTGGDPSVIVGEIKAILGIEVADDADPTAILAAIRDALKKKGKTETEGEGGEGGGEETVASKAVLKALGLDEKASAEEVVVSINTLTQGKDGIAAMKHQLDKATQELAEIKANELIEPFIKAGKILPNDEADLRACRKLAMTDPKTLVHHMERRVANPPPGRTTAPDKATGTREEVIAHSRKEYDEGGTKGRLTDRVTFVQRALVDAKLAGLGDEERAALA